MLHTRLCELLDIEVPIFCAPMGPDLTSPELAAAVSNAGGLGLISFGGNPPSLLRQLIRRMRDLTDKPFGINFILALTQEGLVDVCIEEGVPVLSFFWGDPSPYIQRAHDAGIRVIHQVGSVADAQTAVSAGVDVVIAQGFEAGGHVIGKVATFPLVPRVVDAITPTPVVAAGGIADARGLIAALALGAQGVVLGTRFLASVEANAHALYKRKVVEANEEDTVHTLLFGGGWPDAPHRVLRTPFVEEWLADEQRGQAQRSDEPVIGQTRFMGETIPVTRFSSFAPSTHAHGDIKSMSFLAGQSAGLVKSIQPAGDIVRELVAGAEEIIKQELLPLLQERRVASHPRL